LIWVIVRRMESKRTLECARAFVCSVKSSGWTVVELPQSEKELKGASHWERQTLTPLLPVVWISCSIYMFIFEGYSKPLNSLVLHHLCPISLCYNLYSC
jgi:hypothetical protein